MVVRKEKQDELLKRKNEETLKRLTEKSGGGGSGGPSTSGRKISDVVSYRSVSDMPPLRDLSIQVGRDRVTGLQTRGGREMPLAVSCCVSDLAWLIAGTPITGASSAKAAEAQAVEKVLIRLLSPGTCMMHNWSSLNICQCTSLCKHSVKAFHSCL